jgi:hypothetical protein
MKTIFAYLCDSSGPAQGRSVSEQRQAPPTWVEEQSYRIARLNLNLDLKYVSPGYRRMTMILCCSPKRAAMAMKTPATRVIRRK